MIDEFLKATTVAKLFIFLLQFGYNFRIENTSRFIKNQRLDINSKDFYLCLLLNFAVWSTIGSLLPYLPVFYRSIGLSAEQTGFVIALKSLIGGAGCIFWGAFADKFKKRKVVFVLSILSWLVFALGMTLLPPNKAFKSGEIQGVYELPKLSKAANIANNLTENMKCYEQGNTSIAQYGECSKNNAKGYSSLTGYPKNKTRDKEVGAIIKPSGGVTKQVFALSMVTVAVWSFFGSASAPLLDDIVFRIIPRDQNTYGRFRSVGSLGYGVAALVVGIFVKDYVLSKTDVILTPDYRPAFYMTMAFSVLCVLAVIFIDLTEDDSALLPVPRIPVFKNRRLLAVFGTVFCLGMCHNMIQNFLLWYVEDIDGTHVCMGIIVLTEHLSEIPFFFFGEYAIKLFGHTRIVACACVVYAFRFLSYSIITKPWLIVPFEVGNGLTLGLMWASAASYVCLVTPEKHQATTLGILGGLHFQLGHFLSAILAGEMITYIGFKASWWIYAAFILLVGGLYVVADTLLPKIESYEELEGKNEGRPEDSTVAEPPAPVPESSGGHTNEQFESEA